MFRVIRIKRVAVDLPAGVVFDFEIAQDVCIFMWGRSIKDYIIIKNGDVVDITTSDLSEIFDILTKE